MVTFEETRLSPAQLKQVCAVLEQNPKLKVATFNYWDLKLDGAIALVTSLSPNLTSLELSHDLIGDEGAKALTNVLPPSLANLNLSHNDIGYDGVKALADSLPSRLASLDLPWSHGAGCQASFKPDEPQPLGKLNRDPRCKVVGKFALSKT